MPRRQWDDGWPRYPASVPLPAPGGLATSKQRGPMAATWWSQRFIKLLESYGLGARMQRGRRYARTGQVLDLDVRPAVIAAHVQGSRRTPYLVTISLKEPTAKQWKAIDAAIAAKVGFAARLLAGEVPPDLEEVFSAAGVPLFPGAWREFGAECSCPDRENPCKHIAAVLYIFADQLDADPWLVLAWRGRAREQILEPFLAGAAPDAPHEDVAPWWPFAPGPLPRRDGDHAPVTDAVIALDQADAVLGALEALDAQIGDTPLVELLRPAYEHIVDAPVDAEPV